MNSANISLSAHQRSAVLAAIRNAVTASNVTDASNVLASLPRLRKAEIIMVADRFNLDVAAIAAAAPAPLLADRDSVLPEVGETETLAQPEPSPVDPNLTESAEVADALRSALMSALKVSTDLTASILLTALPNADASQIPALASRFGVNVAEVELRIKADRADRADKLRQAEAEEKAKAAAKTVNVGIPMDWDEAQANLDASLAKDGAISVPLPRIDLTPATGYQRMNTGRDIALLSTARQNVALWGPAGSSKTFPICEEFKRVGRPFVLVQSDSGVTVGDILGREIVTVDPKTGQTVTRFQEGLLPVCMRAGVPIVFDEIDFIPAGITPTLNDVGENRRITIRQTGICLNAHKGFIMLATGNSVGDETGLYTGTQPMNTALLSRFRHIRVEYPTMAQERSILEKVGVSKITATQIAMAFAELRKAFTEARAFGQAPSVRAAVGIARLVVGKTPDGDACPPAEMDDAFSWAFANCLVPAERVVAKEIWQRHTGVAAQGQATYSA